MDGHVRWTMSRPGPHQKLSWLYQYSCKWPCNQDPKFLYCKQETAYPRQAVSPRMTSYPGFTLKIHLVVRLWTCSVLKERYPVTAHAPNLDFWTGFLEIKRCEERKRTLKNPFAFRLAEFNTILKLLRITDQWYMVPVKFPFGRNRDFWRYFYCRSPEDQKMGSALMPIEGLFLLPASIQAQIIVKGIRRNETATIKTVRKKSLRHWCDWGDLVELSFVKQNVLQRRVSKLLSEPPYHRQKQTNRR